MSQEELQLILSQENALERAKYLKQCFKGFLQLGNLAFHIQR